LLHVIPVTMLEIVWVLENVYKIHKKSVRELAEAIINTPQLKVELTGVFLDALKVYEERNVKFTDAVMVFWTRASTPPSPMMKRISIRLTA